MSRESIRVVGARQHSLKNLEVEIPHHQLTVVTGLSGSGKSSLAFDTLYAEGQRRYVETFSPYTRQFLERMDKPDVDRIDGIPPAIAIEQSNSVRTSRSTVGTMTEIADHLKMLFARLSRLIVDGREIRPRTTPDIVAELLAEQPGKDVLLGFTVTYEKRPTLRAALESLRQQGFLRVQVGADILRTDEAEQLPANKKAPASLLVIQDRVKLVEENQSRLAEAIESALLHGHGLLDVWERGSTSPMRFSNRWHDPITGTDYEPPKPSLFSFNNPVGACPTCRGFGRTIEIDYQRALPDRNLSIADGVVKPWQSGISAECQKDLLKACKKARIPTDVPFVELTQAQQDFVVEGVRNGKTADEQYESGDWYGVKGYFDWLESKTYKMHVRVLLSRYRAYRSCPDCKGGRFQPQTLLYQLPSEQNGQTKLLNLAKINQLPLREALTFLAGVAIPEGDEATAQLKKQATDRLHYLVEVGLGYLTLNRATRSLSGGEIERVNLTSCLGNSLVNTLFVLDEPSIGLHPRDTAQLVQIIEALRDRGNTIVVVEHEEAIMQAADHILDLGPGRGEQGGEIVFAGSYPKLLADKKSLTGAYLSERKVVPLPQKRREIKPRYQLRIKGATVHNLQKLNVDIPLGVLVGVSGVSGSGKSTLVHDVVYSGLLREQNKSADDANMEAEINQMRGAGLVSEVIRVDQSPLSKTPRSTPALYLGVYEDIRQLFAKTEESLARGLKPGDFSFNAGNGRCTRCGGTGHEKIEMQFLADIYVTCPACEGKRFLPHVLAIQYRGKSIHDVLSMTAAEALVFYAPNQTDLTEAEEQAFARICASLQLLADIGLGYLRLGQPLNQLSGGEAQRLKLLSYLQESSVGKKGTSEELPAKRPTRLFILDEPTTGLHFEDIRLLLQLLQRMVDAGDSLLVIEHNLEVLKCADWLLELGPEAGDQGGQLVAAGTPEDIAAHPTSHTGRYLKPKLNLPTKRKKSNGVLRETAPKLATPKATQRSANGLASSAISIRGARHHNLKDLSLDIELNEMTVLTGLSGSGKSTLAFDLLFAEGQRRYLDSLNAYARQFVEQLEKPDVDAVTGIPPAVAIEQRLTRGGRKSTVATITEVHQFLRLLFAKVGQAHDPDTGEPAIRQTNTEILERLEKARGRKEMLLLAPLIKGRKGYHSDVAKWAEKKGFPELRVDGKHVEPSKFQRLERFVEHDIDLVLGNLTPKQSPDERRRLVEAALTYGKGTLYAINEKGEEQVYSTHLYCPGSGRSFDELDPRLFSFNSVHGWCPTCQGYGTVFTVKADGFTEAEREIATEAALESAAPEDIEVEVCPTCQGERLNDVARAVRLSRTAKGKPRSKQRVDLTIGEIGRLTIGQAADFFAHLKLSGRDAAVARDILPEIAQRLRFLEEVGLEYLTLDRAATTLSGGESQRIRLAAQLGSNLQGVLYVLDEPTIGLHPRDNAHLLKSLQGLKDKGNTLVVVEHDEDTMRTADRVIDLGPGAGINGGKIVADGNWKKLAKSKGSVTGQILGDPMPHPSRGKRRPIKKETPRLQLKAACANNIWEQDVKLPLRRLVGVCGVSGAGKSTLVHDLIRPAAESLLQKRAKKGKDQPWDEVLCDERFYQVYEVDQSPIGKTSRSTPATYIGLMDELRKLYAQLPLARQRGYMPGRFSFNSGNGRCEKCQGQGAIKVEMNFLPTTFVPCDACNGRRYNRETLEVKYDGASIADVLEMTVETAVGFFEAVPRLQRPLQLLADTGLGYLTLGQRSPTLSGGEAQRIKLVAELARSLEVNANKRLKPRGFENAHNLYLLEEPTIGLHLADVRKLLDVLHQLVDAGHSVIVIEHHLDVLAECDHLIEMGPEGGERGGKVVVAGTPEQLAKHKRSATAPYLREVLT